MPKQCSLPKNVIVPTPVTIGQFKTNSGQFKTKNPVSPFTKDPTHLLKVESTQVGDQCASLLLLSMVLFEDGDEDFLDSSSACTSKGSELAKAPVGDVA